MNVIVKSDVNKYLYKILGSQFMVDSWWHSENLHFDFKTPEEVYQSGAEGRKLVLETVEKTFSVRK